jgi:hypothetical protein
LLLFALAQLASSIFTSEHTITVSSLLGVVSEVSIAWDSSTGLSLEKRGSLETTNIEKVNGLAFNGRWLALGGFDKAGKGVAEVWRVPPV